MGIFKNRLKQFTSGRFTFDKLTIILMAIICIGLPFTESTPKGKGVVHAEKLTVEETTGVEIPKMKNTSGDENTLEGSILTITSSGVESVTSSTEDDYAKLNIDKLDDHQLEFIHMIIPIAVTVAQEYNVYPSIVVAQSILESDWGRSPLAVNANNLFGIKGTYKGSYIMHDTKEDDGTGFQYNVTDKFAKYPSYKESIESNASLLRNGLTWDSEYYSGAWVENTSNYQEATLFLTGTYATDINYNQKVNGVIKDYGLAHLDDNL